MNRLTSFAKLTGQLVAGVFGTLAKGCVCLALLSWSFVSALWNVVIMGREAEDLL